MKKTYKPYPYAPKNISNIVFVSGNTRSGKALVLKIIASLNGVEKVNVNFLMEQANFLSFTNNIKKDVAIYFLRRSFSILDYNLRIGREVNFKKSDFTSIYDYRNPKRYIRNLKSKEGDRIIEILKREKNVIPLMVHNGLLTTNLFDAFDNFRIIEMIRNPINTIFSWINKGYDEKFYDSYRASCLTLRYKKKVIPYYAYGWEKKYLKLNKYERIIEIFSILEKQKERTLKKISKKSKKKILYIKLEDLHLNPLKKERLPRKINLEEIKSKKNFLKKKISSIYFKKLLLLESKYLKKY